MYAHSKPSSKLSICRYPDIEQLYHISIVKYEYQDVMAESLNLPGPTSNDGFMKFLDEQSQYDLFRGKYEMKCRVLKHRCSVSQDYSSCWRTIVGLGLKRSLAYQDILYERRRERTLAERITTYQSKQPCGRERMHLFRK